LGCYYPDTVDSLKLYEALEASDLTETQAKSITQAISSAWEDQTTVQDKGLATKVGSDKFDSEMHRIEDTIKQESSLLRAEMEKLRESVRADLNAAKFSIVRWMFIFWVGQAATTIGIVFVVIKALK
jgi:predicted RNA-binding protein with PIN domain